MCTVCVAVHDCPGSKEFTVKKLSFPHASLTYQGDLLLMSSWLCWESNRVKSEKPFLFIRERCIGFLKSVNQLRWINWKRNILPSKDTIHVCICVCVCVKVINTQAEKRICEKGQLPSPWITAHLWGHWDPALYWMVGSGYQAAFLDNQ